MIDIAAMERELRDLWKQMAHPNEGAVTRACVLNLMIYAPEERSDSAISQIVADVSTENPGRMIVLLSDPGAGNDLNGWVTALCHLAAGGRKQVCCEEIIVRAGGDSVRNLASVAMPLLVPDLPTFLWWRGDLLKSQLFEDLVENADRMIIDSALFSVSDPQAIVNKIFEIQQKNEWCAISDLNWARLTPWRLLIAEFYDLPGCRVHFSELDRIEIKCPSSFRLHARLILGWLASRLGWRNNSISTQIREANQTSIHFYQRNAEFVVSNLEKGYLSSEVYLAGKKRNERVIPLVDQSESNLLNKELSILGHDLVYEKTIEFLAKG